MNKSTFLAVAFGMIAFVGLALGAYTTFTDLKTTGDMLVGDTLTVVGDTVLGGPATADYIILSEAVNVAVTTPTVVGQLVRNASFVVYIASGTAGVSQWIKVGAQ
jgi:hypothetical protein